MGGDLKNQNLLGSQISEQEEVQVAFTQDALCCQQRLV